MEFRRQASTVLECMREELDDHRLAINENTAELEAQNEVLGNLHRKLDKLAERVDELTLLVKGESEQPRFVVQPLSAREKETFHALYELTATQPFASYEQIARKALLSRELVACYVTGLLQKGVPLVKKYDGNRVYLRIDPRFRDLQAKNNVVGLDAPLTCWIQ